MCENLKFQEELNRVRVKLNADQVKLWLAPYFVENGGGSSEMERLSADYSGQLGIPRDKCLSALVELQANALDKLEARKKFQESGLANFKIRAPHQSNLLSVDEQLGASGLALQDQVAGKLGISSDRLKLVVAGKILDIGKSLNDQGLVNGQKLMAIIIEVDLETNRASESIHERIKHAREDATLLLKDENYMHMEDQHGNTVHLPADERKAIMMALALHEKGKSALKRSHFNEALCLLLEADQEYSKCTSQLLKSVDNYALLYLDIVWCYVQLKSADQLQDAENRLRLCEEQMRASYGPDLKRVQAIKGNTSSERCLLMRLHLMQAIVYYHQNKRVEAKAKFNLVSGELNGLKISDDSVKRLTEMGFSEGEARIALRETSGHVTNAVNRIQQLRESRSAARKVGRKERKLADKKTITAEWVNPKSLASLKDMGFDEDLASVALRECKNDLMRAINLLNDAPGLIASCSNTAVTTKKTKAENQSDSLMKEIVSFEFGADLTAKIYVALKSILPEQRDLFLEQIQNCEDSREELVKTLLVSMENPNQPSSSSGGVKNQERITQAMSKATEFIEEQKAFERFSEDINDDADDYLDFPLDDEEQLLVQYKSILEM